jgi:hypothetical protein
MGNPLVRFCRGTGEQPRIKPRKAPVYSTNAKGLTRSSFIKDTISIVDYFNEKSESRPKKLKIL